MPLISPQDLVDKMLQAIEKRTSARLDRIGTWARNPSSQAVLEGRLAAAIKLACDQLVAKATFGSRSFALIVEFKPIAAEIWQRQNQNLKATLPVEDIMIGLSVLSEDAGWPLSEDRSRIVVEFGFDNEPAAEGEAPVGSGDALPEFPPALG